MLRTLAIVLVVLWLLGLVSPLAIGNLVHALLVLAVVLLLIDVISSRR